MASTQARKPQAALDDAGYLPSPMANPSKRSAKQAGLAQGESKPKRQRTKAGCITCRVRGKKCDETRLDDGETCETCKRLRLHCLGFQDRRPDWLRSKENIKIWRKRVTEFLLSQGLVKGHAGCGLRPANAPDASLTLDDMRRDLDAPGQMAGDADSPSGAYERDMESETPHPFNGMMGHPLTLPPLHNIPPEPENPQYIPNMRRFENAIGGSVVDDDRHKWVPPPPFGPPLKLEDQISAVQPRAQVQQQPRQPQQAQKNPPNFSFNQPFNPDYNPKYYREPRAMHNASGSTGSIGDIKTDYTGMSSTSGTSAPPSAYNGVSNNGSSSMYNLATPSLSPTSTSHAPNFAPPKSAQGAGYSQPPPNPASAMPGFVQNSEPGQSSGPERFPLRSGPYGQPQTSPDGFVQPLQPARHDATRFEPYRRPSVPLYHRNSSSSSDNSSIMRHHDSLSIQTSSVRPGASISPTQFSNRSIDSTSPDSFNTGSYGQYTTTPDAYGSYPANHMGMGITNLAQASAASTPVHGPPSSVVSAMTPTPTTMYSNEGTGSESGSTIVTTTYFGGQPAYAYYDGSGQPYTQMLVQPQAPPSTSLTDFFVQRYFTHVIGVQYRLANHQTLPRTMFDLSERSLAVKTSISLLSVLYFEAQQLAQAGIGGTVLGSESLAGQGALGDTDVFTSATGSIPHQALDLGVPGLGFINSSSLIPSNTTNSRAQFDLLYARIKKLLDEARITKGERYDEGDAMACLHVISAFLFSGGRGNWDQFLQIAASWVWGRVSDYSGNVAQALAQMDSMSRFIFRTTMWMDVFGSISLCRPPRFLQIYRTLFRPGALDTMASIAIETNMDRVMGCPNEVVLAFAEVANLEHRKADLLKRFNSGQPMGGIGAVGLNGFPINWSLNGPGAAEMWRQEMGAIEADGIQIERLIPESYGPAALPMNRIVEIQAATVGNNQKLSPELTDLNLFGSPPDAFAWLAADGSAPPSTSPSIGAADETAGYVDPDEEKRRKIAEVFRNAARVYLHSVILGCDPLVPKIRRAVQATVRALDNLGASPLDRSLIFPLTITGCLAATIEEVNFCIQRLSAVGKDAESLGNCLAARQLIGRVWEKRIEGGYTSIDGSAVVGGSGSNISWRTVMMENRNPLLLV